MPILYVCGTEPGIGKTAFASGLGQRLRRLGLSVRYTKLAADEHDRDVTFISTLLGHPPLRAQPGAPAPVAPLDGRSDEVLLVEGPVDHAVDVRGDAVVLVARYRGRETLARIAATDLPPGGLVLNAVPHMYLERVRERTVPALEAQGWTVLGVVPHEQLLHGVPVRVLAERLQGRWLCGEEHGERLVARLAMAGGMLQDALVWFSRRPHNALICKGDRADLPLTALQAGSVAIFLTEGLQPGPQVLAGARARGVPVISVRQQAMRALETIEDLFTDPGIHHPQKAAATLALVERHVTLDRLADMAGLAVCAGGMAGTGRPGPGESGVSP